MEVSQPLDHQSGFDSFRGSVACDGERQKARRRKTNNKPWLFILETRISVSFFYSMNATTLLMLVGNNASDGHEAGGEVVARQRMMGGGEGGV
jgi:hypothetical protein